MTAPSATGSSRARLAARLLGWTAASLTAALTAVLLFWKPAPSHEHDEASGRGSPSVPPSSQAVHSGHETRDMNGRVMMWLTIGLGAVIAIVIGLMLLLMSGFHHERSSNQRPLTAEQTMQIRPPTPNLQVDPVTELARMHEHEDQLLYGYGWIDGDRTRARIPIKRAMELTVGHGLGPMP